MSVDKAPPESDGRNPDVNESQEVPNSSSLFSSMRSLPTLSYTVQNILISMGTLGVAFSSLVLTVMVILPLAIVRGITPRNMLTKEPTSAAMRRRGKVVLIMGASRGIGMEVLKQYAPEPNTTVIAVAKDPDNLRQAIVLLGPTPATIQMETIDLSGSPKEIARAVEELDRQYGPISHMYAISGVSNHLKNETAFNLDAMEKMIKINVSGTVAVTMGMYELMRKRKYGRICIVGSVAGIYGPANMIGYASTKSFVNTFGTSLRTLASANNVEVVTVEPGFIDTRMTRMMRGQGSRVPASSFADADAMAAQMKRGVERGGVGVVTWPLGQSVQMNALKGLNPICDELGRWVSTQLRLSGKKIT